MKLKDEDLTSTEGLDKDEEKAERLPYLGDSEVAQENENEDEAEG